MTASTPSDFSEHLRILLSRRRAISAFIAIACIVALLLSAIGPEVYRAQALLLVEQASGGGFPTSLADNPAIMDFLVGGGGTYHSGRVFLEMLASRSVLEGVARQLDLVKVFRHDDLPPAEAMEETVTQLKDASNFLETESGVIRVRVRVGTPFFPTPEKRRQAADLAAAITNAFAEQLNRVNEEKSVSRARSLRIYLEDQIKVMRAGMQATSDSLARFQLDNRAVALEEQTKATVLGAGELRGQIAAAEIELGLLERTMRAENPQVRAVRSKLAELRKQYDKLTFGSPLDAPAAGTGDFLVPFASLPAVGQRLAALMLDLKIKQTALQLLTQQYYQAKIDETRNLPSLSVLDAAIPPVHRSSPRRKMVLASTFLASFLAAVIVSFGLENRDRRRGLAARPGPATLGEAWRADRLALMSLLTRQSGPRGTA